MKTTLILIRHGQTTWNREERVRGQADVPLDETGLWQAGVTARTVAARWPLTAVYASPLDRAVKTAAAVAAAQGLTVQPLAGLLDMDFGDWTGLTNPDLEARYPALLRAWIEAPHTARFPGGEGLDEVRQRVTGALAEIVTRHAGETVALVAHTLVNRVILCAAMDLGNDHFWRWGQNTCAVNVIEWDGQRYSVALVNDTSHLWREEG